MPIFKLGKKLAFPPVHLAEDGLLAVGGDLSVPRLLLAYSSGIFPWYEDGEPILWHSPDPRTLLTVDTLHVSRRMERTLKQGKFRVTSDRAFEHVIAACANTPRDDQFGTWITDDMQAAYTALHREGYAHSIECWHDDHLVGGLYGVSLGACFFGESMFSWQADASKAALITLTRAGARAGIRLVDCQMETVHLKSMGAFNVSRARYVGMIEEQQKHPTLRGTWDIEAW